MQNAAQVSDVLQVKRLIETVVSLVCGDDLLHTGGEVASRGHHDHTFADRVAIAGDAGQEEDHRRCEPNNEDEHPEAGTDVCDAHLKVVDSLGISANA